MFWTVYARIFVFLYLCVRACVCVCICVLFSCCWLLNSIKKIVHSFICSQKKRPFDSFGVSLHFLLRHPFRDGFVNRIWMCTFLILGILCVCCWYCFCFNCTKFSNFSFDSLADSITACSSVLFIGQSHKCYCELNLKSLYTYKIINMRWKETM